MPNLNSAKQAVLSIRTPSIPSLLFEPDNLHGRCRAQQTRLGGLALGMCPSPLIEARNRKQQQPRRTERCTCLKNLQLELHRHPCKTGHAERTSCSRVSGGCRRGRHQKGRPSVQAMSHHEMPSRCFFYKVQLRLRKRRNGRCTGSCPSSTIPIRIPMRNRKGDQSITTRPKHVTALFVRKFGEIRDAYEATHGALGRARDASCTHLHALPA